MIGSYDSHVNEIPVVWFWDTIGLIVRFEPSIVSFKRKFSILYIRSPNLSCRYYRNSSIAKFANKPKAIYKAGSSYIFIKYYLNDLIHQLDEKAWGRTMLTFILAQLIR